MKNLLIITFLISNFIFSQSNKIEVTYAVQFEGDFLSEKAKKNPTLEENFKGIEEALNKTKLFLLIQNNKSLFYGNKILKKDNLSSGEENAINLSGQENTYFRDLDNKTLVINTDFTNKTYNVSRDINFIKWNITSEIKNINGYICFKATGKDPDRTKEIIAWFCPKLPYQTGPIEYGALPGLILELSYGKMKYLATQINLDSKNTKKIELPVGKNIDQKEFDEIINTSMSNFGNK